LFQVAQLFHERMQLELNVFVTHLKLHTKVNELSEMLSAMIPHDRKEGASSAKAKKPETADHM
jgi:hypothetical protein